MTKLNRRVFIKNAAIGAAGVGLAASIPQALLAGQNKDQSFKLALSQFSFASQFWTNKTQST